MALKRQKTKNRKPSTEISYWWLLNHVSSSEFKCVFSLTLVTWSSLLLFFLTSLAEVFKYSLYVRHCSRHQVNKKQHSLFCRIGLWDQESCRNDFLRQCSQKSAVFTLLSEGDQCKQRGRQATWCSGQSPRSLRKTKFQDGESGRRNVQKDAREGGQSLGRVTAFSLQSVSSSGERPRARKRIKNVIIKYGKSCVGNEPSVMLDSNGWVPS